MFPFSLLLAAGSRSCKQVFVRLLFLLEVSFPMLEVSRQVLEFDQKSCLFFPVIFVYLKIVD